MGNQLPHPLTSKIVECVGNKNFRACCVGMNGLREAMEDDHMMHLTDSWGAFGVFDGHAGAQCSQFCAKKFPKAITKANPPISDEKCQEISLEIDREFAEDNKESGSTAAIAIVTPAKEAGHFDIQVSNVGDSRVIVGRKMGQECVSLTVDHKPTLKAERERIEACGGTVSMDRVDGQLAMSRAIGDLEYKKGTDGPLKQKVIAQPDITHCDVTAEDFLLICCDGIFESNFSNEAVVEFLKDQIAENAQNPVTRREKAVAKAGVYRLIEGKVASSISASGVFLSSSAGAYGYSGTGLFNADGALVGIQSESDNEDYTATFATDDTTNSTSVTDKCISSQMVRELAINSRAGLSHVVFISSTMIADAEKFCRPLLESVSRRAEGKKDEL